MPSEVEIRTKSMLKAYRSQVRLRYSIAADEEINRNIEEVKDQIANALHLGLEVRLTPAQLTIGGDAVAIEANHESA